MGLNKLAEEVWADEPGRAMVVFRTNGSEAGPEPENDGWAPYGGTGAHDLQYVADPIREVVTRMTTTAAGAMDGRFILGDRTPDDWNPNAAAWHEVNRRHLALWGKNANVSQPSAVVALVRVEDNQAEMHDRQAIFHAETALDHIDENGDYHFYLGSQLNDGAWHYLEFDLAARVTDVTYGAECLAEANGLRLWRRDAWVDVESIDPPASAAAGGLPLGLPSRAAPAGPPHRPAADHPWRRAFLLGAKKDISRSRRQKLSRGH